MLPGTWSLLVFGVIPLLVAGVASAAPTYPVNLAPETLSTVSYEAASHIPTPVTLTPDTVDAVPPGVDDIIADVSVSVAGPNGEVGDGPMNHGQIVRQSHELAECRQLGCVTRTVAQSDLGKDDQQRRPQEQSTSTDTTGSVDPSLLDTECSDNSVPSKPTPGNASQNRPDGREEPKGKSSDAPGMNK